MAISIAKQEHFSEYFSVNRLKLTLEYSSVNRLKYPSRISEKLEKGTRADQGGQYLLSGIKNIYANPIC